ncbi:MAG: hypothetical protein R3212_07120 [Xanthomonadales bacterium]|nr:hypothetical protein [Xanthomonadales bacterium]
MYPRLAVSVFALAFLVDGVAQDPLSTDPQSGLVIDTDWELVRANCSGCHSTALVTQNRMNAEGWLHTIRWMQQKHNLWDLGESEDGIIAYLERNYGVLDRPHRRQPINQPPLDEDETP